MQTETETALEICEQWNADLEELPKYGTPESIEILDLMHAKDYEQAVGLIMAYRLVHCGERKNEN